MVLCKPDGKKMLSFSSSGLGKGISLPCGRCIGCRLERARQWAVRILHESKMHDQNSFITLTYDDKHVPADGSISVDHCQKFLKKFRRKIEPARIRFFLCGEYGEKLDRPHYHAIVFGWFPSDAVLIKGSGELSLWSSSMLSDTWGNGFTSVGGVSFDSASYVASYAVKKINGEKASAHYQGRRPEFLLMSRRPGIGASWFKEFSGDVFPSDEVIVRGHQTRPPRYYDNLLDKLNPVMLESLKVKREIESERLEEVLHDGFNLEICPSRNARRLRDRQRVAEAKFKLKSRHKEN